MATGTSVFVRTADGLTDLHDTVSPSTTVARDTDAVRMELDDAERWDAEGNVL